MAKFGFESGWSAGQDFIESQRQKRRDKSDRKLSRAQTKVMKEEAKTAKLEREALVREGHYDSGRFKLSKAQKDRISEAEKRDKERGWDKSDIAEAPKLLKQFEQAHEGSKGALAGGFIEETRAGVKEKKASAKSSMAAAKQEKIKADLDKKISKKYVDKDFQSLADSRVRSEVSASNLAQANADFRQKEVDDYTDKVTAGRDVSQQNANSDTKMAESRYMEAVTNQKLYALEKNKYDDTQSAATNNTSQIGAIDNQAGAVREQMALILKKDASGKFIYSPQVIEEKIRLAIAESGKPPAGASKTVREYNEKVYNALQKEWDEMGKNELLDAQYVKRKAYQALKGAARASVSSRSRDQQLAEATEKHGTQGEEDVLTRNYLVDRFKTLGVPLSFLNEDTESNPNAKNIFAYHQSEKVPFKLDNEGKPILFKGADGSETQDKNMLLDMDVTIDTAESFAQRWLLENPIVKVERVISTGEAPAGGLSFDVPTKDQSQAMVHTSSVRTTLQGTSPLAVTKSPAGRELLPHDQAAKVAEFLDGFRKGQGVLSGSSLPTVTDDVVGEMSTDPAPEIDSPAETPTPIVPDPENEAELQSNAGINDEQAKGLDELGVPWRDSELSGPALIKNEISSASKEVEWIKGSIKEKSTALKKGRAATKPSDLSGIGGTTSAVNLSPKQKIALRKEIERDESELKAREKKLLELKRLLAPAAKAMPTKAKPTEPISPPVKGRNPASERDRLYKREHPSDVRKRIEADRKEMDKIKAEMDRIKGGETEAWSEWKKTVEAQKEKISKLHKDGKITGNQKKEMLKAIDEIKSRGAKEAPFPTKHPNVRNPDGSVSNVKTITVESDGKHYVIPSMVDGKQLSGDEAWKVARSKGLEKYPVFDTAEKALKASKELHDKQPAPEEKNLAKEAVKKAKAGIEKNLEEIRKKSDRNDKIIEDWEKGLISDEEMRSRLGIK